MTDELLTIKPDAQDPDAIRKLMDSLRATGAQGAHVYETTTAPTQYYVEFKLPRGRAMRTIRSPESTVIEQALVHAVQTARLLVKENRR